MAFQNVGTLSLGTIGEGKTVPIALDANGVASGQAFLISELEKRDNLIREPLKSVTYARDITVRVGGGWVDDVSSVSVEYGITGGSDSGVILAGGSNGIPMLQANFDKETFKAHAIGFGVRTKWVDVQKGKATGRNLDNVLTNGARLVYDKHLDSNLYVGFTALGTTGLVNNANVTATTAATGGGGSTTWALKTADEILADINTLITNIWDACGNDLDAFPNHILIPFAQFNLIATKPVTAAADKSILEYVKEKNIGNEYGVKLFIGGCNFCKSAGTGSTDRMVGYVNKERFCAMDELQPLTRGMTSANASEFAYDTVYAGNVSEAELFYTEAIAYMDGI